MTGGAGALCPPLLLPVPSLRQDVLLEGRDAFEGPGRLVLSPASHSPFSLPTGPHASRSGPKPQTETLPLSLRGP